ncbi:MAG: oligosaccharide flippase family protein [bacterium]
MNKVYSNILANVIGRFWAVVSIYLFIPFYIRYLGIEAYGIVGFYAVLQGVLIIADAGLTATLNRELARLSALPGREKERHNLVRTIEVIYWTIAVSLGLLLQALLQPVLITWINPGSLSPEVVDGALRLMIWAVVLQLPSSLYQGGLLGLQRQVLANVLQISWSVIRNGGGVLVLIFVSPTLQDFFRWHIFCNALYSVVLGVCLWQSLRGPVPERPSFTLQSVRNVWKYAAGMATIALLSVLAMQVDKLVVANLLPLKVFAYYSLASMISQVPILLAGPISTAVFPRLTALVAMGDLNAMASLYRRACQLVSLLAISVGVMIWFFAPGLIFAWTHSSEVAANAAPMVGWFVAGFAIQAIMYIPFQLALAHSYVRINIVVSVCSLALFVPLMIVLITRYGAIGGAVAWALLNVIIFFPYITLLHRRFMPEHAHIFYSEAVGVPLAVALVIGYLMKMLFPQGDSSILTIAVAAGGVVLSVICGACLLPGFPRPFGWSQWPMSWLAKRKA